MMSIFFRSLLLTALVFCAVRASANNLSITNVSVPDDTTITFDISWENSWRVTTAPNNWDAVWIFVKRKDCSDTRWVHVRLDSTSANHTAGSPLEVQGVEDSVGVFLRRQNPGLGNISSVACTLQMEALGSADYDFQVFGIEMVWIPEEAYSLGDGSSDARFRDGNTNNPFLVTTAGAISVGGTVGQLSAAGNVPSAAIPATYPNGYSGYYVMKYELSQGQYAAFLNSLASDQAGARYQSVTTFRHNLTGTWPNITSSVPHRAMGFLSWQDMLAYFDWSGLRPMTEMEYEKAVRGPAPPVAGGFAWATTTFTDVNAVVNDGTDTEAVSGAVAGGSGAVNFNGTSPNLGGPYRVGFAAGSGTDRLQSGASYYGVMELTGNIAEMCVSTHNATGLAFTGNHGDGELTIAPGPGNSNVANWNTTSAESFILRGGSFNSTPEVSRASDRLHVNGNTAVNMFNGTVYVTNSGFKFYDSGGPSGNYANCQLLVITFRSICGSPVRIRFNSTTLSGINNPACGGPTTGDRLTVYNGATTAAGVFVGPVSNIANGSVYTSNNPDNAITVRFYSDNATVAAGWDADILQVNGNCYTPSLRHSTNGGRGVRNF